MEDLSSTTGTGGIRNDLFCCSGFETKNSYIRVIYTKIPLISQGDFCNTMISIGELDAPHEAEPR